MKEYIDSRPELKKASVDVQEKRELNNEQEEEEQK